MTILKANSILDLLPRNNFREFLIIWLLVIHILDYQMLLQLSSYSIASRLFIRYSHTYIFFYRLKIKWANLLSIIRVINSWLIRGWASLLHRVVLWEDCFWFEGALVDQWRFYLWKIVSRLLRLFFVIRVVSYLKMASFSIVKPSSWRNLRVKRRDLIRGHAVTFHIKLVKLHLNRPDSVQ